RDLPGRIGHRQIDVELGRVRVTRGCKPGSQLVGRLRAGVASHGIAVGVDHRLRIEAAADATRVTLLQSESGLHPEANAELAAELVVRDHDTAFDRHLPDRNVQLPDDAPHLFEAGRRVGYEQDVGAGIDERDTALRDDRTLPARGRRLAGTEAELLL